MRMARVVLAIAVVAALWAGLRSFCLRPLACNRLEYALEQSTLRAFSLQDPFQRQVRARENLVRLAGCQKAFPNNVNLYLLRAANLILTGDRDAAIEEYRDALRHEKRPEIYLNLGLSLVQTSRSEEGTRFLVEAAIRDPNTLEEIPYDSIRNTVRQEASNVLSSWGVHAPPFAKPPAAD